MGKRRKVAIVNEEKENERQQNSVAASDRAVTLNTGPIYTIMSKVQLNETFHKKYIKELKELYTKMNHETFIFTFIKMIKTAMVAEEANEFAYTTLIFCAKFVSSFEGDDTHILLLDICRWLLTTISNNPHIRFRLCQFVNMILNALGSEATLDDVICDSIMEYMVGRLVDMSPSVRMQAILAMQRLQVPDNPDDPVLRSYKYHLCSDPSPRVRQAVITSMGRNYNTIPHILDRLWDIDEKVRRHTYIHMSSYPVRSYKVSQRLTLLEQGLNDRSESVRKVVTNVMLQQWIESYQKDILSLLGALKLDSNESELFRYRKIGKQVLREIFKRQNKADMIACLCLEEDGEFYRCVPYDRLSLEMSFYWQCLTEYLQNEMAEELDHIVPELSTFCGYVETYCRNCKSDMDKFQAMEFQYILLSLMEILYTYDLGDEIGRGNLQKLLHHLLESCTLDEKVVEVIVKCAENLIADQNTRYQPLQFFLDIIQDISGLNTKQQDLVDDRNRISELLTISNDADLNLKLSSLKVKILDLEEQEMDYVRLKDYVRAQEVIEKKNIATEELRMFLKPLLQKHNDEYGESNRPQFTKVVENECILKSLQITYYMVASTRVKSLGHNVCRLFHDLIFRYIASSQIAIRDWALKCGAAVSMLYKPLAKDVFNELYAQFFKNHNIRIWETSITCIFELLDRYGVDSFAVPEEQNKSKKTGRQLYNTLEFIDVEDDTQQSTTLGQGVGVIYMMSHFLDTCDEPCIMRAIINGFCRLVLHGNIENRDVIEKLLLRYFNPGTDPEISQILGVFLENLIQYRKQNLLQPCLMVTVNSVLSAPYDSPLHDIRPETITRFIIDATRPDAVSGNNSENSHNKLALAFLNEMVNNSSNKELCKLLAKELTRLQVNVVQQEEFKREMKQLSDKLILHKYDPKTIKHIIEFRDMLDGVFSRTVEKSDELESDEEDDEPDTNTKEDSVHFLSEDSNIITNQISRNKENTTESEEIDNMQNEGNNNARIASSPTTMLTTFGSDNVTKHRFLRKSLNLSRNNSMDSSTTANNDQVERPNKIRIEARIDSDKKSKEPRKNIEFKNFKCRRSLRCRKRSKIQNEDESGLTHAKTREPEIIEKILKSPPTNKTPTNSENEVCNSSESETAEQQSGKNTPISTEEITVSEEIPESPMIARSGTITRLRSRSSMRLMRSNKHSDASQLNGKTMETVSSLASTPLRNGRKRVLRTSPKLFDSVVSTDMSSPIRKQPCVKKIDTTDASKITTRGSRKCGLAKHSPKISSLKRNFVELGKTLISVASASHCAALSPTSNKENELLKKKSLTNSEKSPIIVGRKLSRNASSEDQRTHNKSITTRNSTKREMMSTLIMTRKRLSQENLSIDSTYLKSCIKSSIGKSRIPVRLKKMDKPLEKKSFSTTHHLESTKIPVVRSLRLKRLPPQRPPTSGKSAR